MNYFSIMYCEHLVRSNKGRLLILILGCKSIRKVILLHINFLLFFFKNTKKYFFLDYFILVRKNMSLYFKVFVYDGINACHACSHQWTPIPAIDLFKSNSIQHLFETDFLFVINGYAI